MGIDEDFGLAYAKAQMASNNRIPISGKIIISVKDKDKIEASVLAKKLRGLGFQLIATRGTAKYLNENGIECDVVHKVIEGRPHIVDLIKNREVSFIINTVTGTQAQKDSMSIRRSALQFNVPYTTTISGARAVVTAIEMLQKKELGIKSIQEYHNLDKFSDDFMNERNQPKTQTREDF